MIAILLAAAVIPNFSAERALRALNRDDETVQACQRENLSNLRTGNLKLTMLSHNPELVLVELYDDTCVCGAHNCPFWIYRVRGPEDERLLTSWAYSVKVARAAGDGIPDVVGTSQWSAALSYETRFTYRNGTFAESGSWKLRGDERKPASVPIHFAPGTSSARLHGTIGLDWSDDYTIGAVKGQSLVVSEIVGQQSTVIRLRGNGVDRTLTPGRSIVLPATGTYSIEVALGNAGDDRDVAYAFTLSIR